MSSVEKMTIVGMRSFGPRQNNTIEFYSPLTLIVGANGSGKTTIIECLRYATTGDLPPNSKGGAFVHDPKLVHETEVLAQVKLSFTAVTGAKMLASRSIKCIQKRTKLEMKTMDSSLQVYDPSTKEKKCAELDMEIPRMLGVPSAILSNVLFCHQEDSNWPLAEPASLKKKFDDIFEATKYTGALQALKNVIKERKSEVLLERKALETLGVLKEQCERIETNVSNLETRVANRQRLCDEKLSEFQGLENELESLQGQLVELQGALESQKERERDARGLENLKKDIREAIGELFEHDSDEQLNQRLEKHRELEVMAVGDFDTLKAEKTAANLELTEFQGQLEKAYSERGLLVGKLQSCQEATLRLQDTLVLVTDQLKLNNSKSPEEILKLIQNELERKKNALVTFREEFREGNDSIARELNELVSAKTRNTELQKTRQKKIDEFQANKRSIAAELVSITEINDNVISELEEEYKKATRELDLQKENENSIANSKIIGQLESERQILQAKTRNVLSELEKASKLGALLAKREVHQAQLMEKRAFMEKKTVECKGDLINYLARVPALPKLLTEVTGVLEEKQGHVRTVQEAVEANGSRLTAAKAKLSWLTLALDKKEAALYEDQLNSEKELDSNDNNNSSNSSLSSLDSLISHLQQELSKCNE